ncbi:hypothetical protein ACMDCR_25830 [Labrys okinawensis]|uniref:hypothetical protein n=1 Tax=Labrys okinawensis TaxID=346911 RepID=UPI0039BC8684
MKLQLSEGHPTRALSDYELANWHLWADEHISHPKEYAADGALRDALVKKYKTPEAAVRALGLDASLLTGAPTVKRSFDRSPTLDDLKKGGRHDYVGRRRLATDEDPDSDESELSPLHRVVRTIGALAPEDFETNKKAFIDFMQRKSAKAEEAEDDDPDMAGDEPEPFPGRPRPGGTMDPMKGAQDGAVRKRFADMHPGAPAVSTGFGFGVSTGSPADRHKAPSAKARASFAEMFPDAMK